MDRLKVQDEKIRSVDASHTLLPFYLLHRAHNALRGDLKTYREALEAAKAHGESLKEWEAACLQT